MRYTDLFLFTPLDKNQLKWNSFHFPLNTKNLIKKKKKMLPMNYLLFNNDRILWKPNERKLS